MVIAAIAMVKALAAILTALLITLAVIAGLALLGGIVYAVCDFGGQVAAVYRRYVA